jgi:hypothetical protein
MVRRASSLFRWLGMGILKVVKLRRGFFVDIVVDDDEGRVGSTRGLASEDATKGRLGARR